MSNLVIAPVFSGEENHIVVKNSYEIKDALKNAGYSYSPANKAWHKSVYNVSDATAEVEALVSLGVALPEAFSNLPSAVAKKMTIQVIERYRSMKKSEQGQVIR